MKKISSFLTVMLLGLGINVFATTANDFDYDYEAHDAEFSEIAEVENAAITSGLSFSEMSDEASPYNIEGFDLATSPHFSIDDMDWGAFAWGFCCWPIGFFVVAINSSKDSDQKLSFWIGAATSVVLSTISTLTVY